MMREVAMPACASEVSVCSSQCFATLRSVTMAARAPGRNAATRVPSDGGFRVLGLQRRPVGAALHALNEDIRIRLQPDRSGLAANAMAGLFAHEGAAAGGQHGGTAVEQPRDHPRLAVPEIRLAVSRENLRNGHAGMSQLDFPLRPEKPPPPPRRRPPPPSGFPRPHPAPPP